MEYTIRRAQTANALIALVNDFIALGWAPQGGVSAYVKPDDTIEYLQAMIK